MGPRIIISSLLLLILFPQPQAAAANESSLRKLYGEKQYFDLRDALRTYPSDPSKELLFYEGAVANKFKAVGGLNRISPESMEERSSCC